MEQDEKQIKIISCNNSTELYKKAAEIEKKGGYITKIYNQPRKGIFQFLFNPKNMVK